MPSILKAVKASKRYLSVNTSTSRPVLLETTTSQCYLADGESVLVQELNGFHMRAPRPLSQRELAGTGKTLRRKKELHSCPYRVADIAY